MSETQSRLSNEIDKHSKLTPYQYFHLFPRAFFMEKHLKNDLYDARLSSQK